MSVIVRGMEMPKNCAYCTLSEYRNTSLGQILDCKRIGTVGTALRDTHDVLNRRHPNCPLVEANETLFSAENARKFLMENPPKERHDPQRYIQTL